MNISKKTYFVKSLERDFQGLKTAIGQELIVTQTIYDILDSQIIKPNTVSFGINKKRLCTTIIDPNYTKTYRLQGIIFELVDDAKPDYILPFDASVLLKDSKEVLDFAKIYNLAKHYQDNKVGNFDIFAYRNRQDLAKSLSDESGKIDTEYLIQIANEYRQERGLDLISIDNSRNLFEYNEATFFDPINVKIAGFFSNENHSHINILADQYDMNIYKSSEDFYHKVIKK